MVMSEKNVFRFWKIYKKKLTCFSFFVILWKNKLSVNEKIIKKRLSTVVYVDVTDHLVP
jgi:hypothetical protein